MTEVVVKCDQCTDEMVNGFLLKQGSVIKSGWLIRCDRCGQAMDETKYQRKLKKALKESSR